MHVNCSTWCFVVFVTLIRPNENYKSRKEVVLPSPPPPSCVWAHIIIQNLIFSIFLNIANYSDCCLARTSHQYTGLTFLLNKQKCWLRSHTTIWIPSVEVYTFLSNRLQTLKQKWDSAIVQLSRLVAIGWEGRKFSQRDETKTSSNHFFYIIYKLDKSHTTIVWLWVVW